VTEMNRAIATTSAIEVAKAFGAVSEAAAEVSRAVAQEDEMNREAKELSRARQAA
jgi:uncharacterized protein with PhoU and TrkA domain